MARVVVVLGIPHFPFHHRLTRAERSAWSEDTEGTAQRGELMREKVRRAAPDALVMVGNDHFHQFFMDNMPAFLLGKLPSFDGTFYNEEREFGLPRVRVPGDLPLAKAILRGMLDREVDLAYSDELKLDHSVVVPLLLVRPELDLPIVPFLSNCVAPPLPTADRFHKVGLRLRATLEAIPGDRRIGVVATGNLSLEVGGPQQFEPGPSDAAFDEAAVGWLRDADVATATRECTEERLHATGNVSHAYLNFLLALGAANDARPSYAEGMKRRGTAQPWFAWEPEE